MAERPILFSGPMVRALLEGRKTQTRRLVMVETGARGECSTVRVRHGEHRGAFAYLDFDGVSGISWRPYGGAPTQPYPWPERCCPYAVGDRLWVRETWAPWDKETHDELDFASKRGNSPDPRLDLPATYRADFPGETDPREIGAASKWRPSIFMPRWACRLVLEVTDVRVQRLQDISEEDAEAEGVGVGIVAHGVDASGAAVISSAVGRFRLLWDSINGKRSPWPENAWVWAITFKRHA